MKYLPAFVCGFAIGIAFALVLTDNTVDFNNKLSIDSLLNVVVVGLLVVALNHFSVRNSDSSNQFAQILTDEYGQLAGHCAALNDNIRSKSKVDAVAIALLDDLGYILLRLRSSLDTFGYDKDAKQVDKLMADQLVLLRRAVSLDKSVGTHLEPLEISNITVASHTLLIAAGRIVVGSVGRGDRSRPAFIEFRP